MVSALLSADVVIVGAGPIGSLVAYQLARNGCKPYIIDQEDKHSAPLYGRATSLWPRTLELFDQLDLLDPLLVDGIATKAGLNFRDGKSMPGGFVFGQRMDRHGDTKLGYSLHLRQRLTERAIEAAYNDLGHEIHQQHQLQGFTVDEADEYPLTASILDLTTNETYQIRTKYLVGADGGRSSTRKMAGIDFIGEKSGAEWIRMDAVVETDMPNDRYLNSVQSPTHGLVLWCPLDNGATRIGYVFGEELQKKYSRETLTVEVAMEEAKKAVAPFTLDFKKVDWFTLYGIGQCIASEFVKDRVILAGDSCHTHSSGSAQGLNTGTFDATNLAWKLSLAVKGLAKPEIVQSYDDERRALVQQVIDNDLIIATLISGKLPPKFAGRTESPRDILTEWFDNAKTQAFTLGIGISYNPNNLINAVPITAKDWPIATIQPGERGPDVLISRVGSQEEVRLQKALRNFGAFQIVVFTGEPFRTLPQLKILSDYLEGPTSFVQRFPGRKIFNFTTIICGEGVAAGEFLGVKPFGQPYFDPARKAHEIYGIDITKGAVCVFRPDGYIATLAPLDAPESLGDHFAKFLIEGAI